MSFEEGSGVPDPVGESPEFETVDLGEFAVPKPVRGSGGRFAKKPAGDRADAKPAKAKARVPNKKGQFREPVTGFYMMVGGMLMPLDAVCGNAFIVAAPKCGEVWDELAYQNEAIRRFLFSLTQVSLTGQLFVAHTPIAMAVFMHHSPFAEKLGAKMGAQMAETIAEQMRGTEPNAD